MLLILCVHDISPFCTHAQDNCAVGVAGPDGFRLLRGDDIQQYVDSIDEAADQMDVDQ